MDRSEVDTARNEWRVAQDRVDQGNNEDRVGLEVARDEARSEFHDVSGKYMSAEIGALRDAEARRQSATPSTPPFHEAAREEEQIAADIFGAARQDDLESPRTRRPDEM